MDLISVKMDLAEGCGRIGSCSKLFGTIGALTLTV